MTKDSFDKNLDRAVVGTGCFMVVIWVVSVLLSLALTGVIIWAIISVVSGLNDSNCFNELGAAVACP